jgi:hypothetical protein
MNELIEEDRLRISTQMLREFFRNDDQESEPALFERRSVGGTGRSFGVALMIVDYAAILAAVG